MSWRQTKEGIIIAISQEKPTHDLHVRNTLQSFLRSTAGTTTLFWLGVTSQTWSVLLPIHQKLNRQVWRGEDRKQMYLCSCTAMTDKDRLYKLRPPRSWIAWSENAVFVGVLVVLYLWKAGDRHTALLMLEHISPKRIFQNYSSRLVWIPLLVALQQHCAALLEHLPSLKTKFPVAWKHCPPVFKKKVNCKHEGTAKVPLANLGNVPFTEALKKIISQTWQLETGVISSLSKRKRYLLLSWRSANIFIFIQKISKHEANSSSIKH